MSKIVKQKSLSRFGRIIVLTGARQTGKTTLVRQLFSDYEYLSIEDPVTRSTFLNLNAQQWKSLYPKAILDEVQKEASIIESIKATYDQWEDTRYVLLGSSQLLLMEKVRETLAGRCSILEIFPLTLPELQTQSWDEELSESLYVKEIQNNGRIDYLPSFMLDKRRAQKLQAYNYYLQIGGYPAVSGDETMDEKYEWLKNYVRTYLERDIRDLASFRDLDSFIELQKYLAINTGNLINASSIGNLLGINLKTVQRYIKYFEISYQGIELQAWARNQNKRLIKTPKYHYLDQGVLQAVIGKRGGMTGNEYESAIISELYKQAKNAQIDVRFFFLRTHDGKEVDLLMEFSDHYVAFEIKMTSKVSKTDVKHLIGLETILDKPLRKAFVLSNDPQTTIFGENIVAIHAAMFLG